ncbi:MAG: hypothetical protein AMS14_01670 [Planctomycetes bacterium DG_20]|nr:MAG: hypothetical protein AMS14_01670 [Planctomycetes bacterium DG_20]
MAASEKLQSLVDQMPEPDNRGTYGNMDKERIQKAVAEIHRGGRDAVVGLIEMLVEPGAGNDIKPRYALHVLAVHVCQLGDDKARAQFARTVASQLAGRPKGVQRYLIRQLQVAGAAEVVETLGQALLDPGLCEPAARALVSIGHGAADQLRGALPKVTGKCRLAVILGLAALADRNAAGAFKEALDDNDADIRIAGAWGLACLADAGSAGTLLKAADGRTGWERIQQTNACLVLAEKLLAAGNKAAATGIYTRLRDARTKPSEGYVRQAAERGLAAAT